MRYHVQVGDQGWRIERTPEGVRMDGRERRAELSWLTHEEVRLSLDGSNHRIFARPTDDGWRVTVRGRTFAVSVEDERTRSIRKLAGQAAGSAGPRELRAPMPGLVVRVLVEPGQRVTAGEGLVVVEAMKMENELRAEAPGTVADVAARSGETVERDDVLLTFEDETT